MIKLLDILKELRIKPDYSILQIYKSSDYNTWKYSSDLINFRHFRIIGEIEDDSIMFRLFPGEINKGDLYLGIIHNHENDFLEILEKNNIFFKIITHPTTNQKGVIIPKGYYEIINKEDINELKIKPDVPKLDAYFDGHYGYEIPKIDSNNNLWLFEKEDNLFFFMLDYNSLNNEDDHSELLKILNNIKTDLDKYKVDYKIDQVNDWTYFIYINADNINIIEK